ncbi:hypothetical protein A4A49_23444 [Nicotiana attenuata]|uniref:Uncharacterized protein n=1 Tax=Nicotiana attenuata TaxID=49451 RepID=A0A314LCW5_NICAT|nr:hypothetical protein A4A49_23444 [Nicotiana attenuata]
MDHNLWKNLHLKSLRLLLVGKGAATGGEDFSSNVEEEVASVENLNGGEEAGEEEVTSESAPGGSSSRQEPKGSQSSRPTQRSSICDEATTTVNRGRGRGRGKAPSAAIRPTKGAFLDALPQTAPKGRAPKPKAIRGSSSAGKRGRGSGPATAESSAASGEKRSRTVGMDVTLTQRLEGHSLILVCQVKGLSTMGLE